MAKGNEILLYLTADNNQLKTKLADSEKALNAALTKMKKGGTDSGIAGTLKNIGVMAGAYIGGQAVRAAVEFAGKLDSVSKSFEKLAAGAQEGSDGLLAAMRTASKGTIDNLSIMESSNLAVKLMGDKVLDYLPEMARIATATAKTQGVSASQMLNDIVVASGRQSVMILDNLGISSVQAGKYMEEYARKLGKTREQLTTSEKSAAFFYATMKAGGDIIKKTGDEALTLGQQFDKMKANMTNVAAGLTRLLTPALLRVSEELNKGVQAWEDFYNASKGRAETESNLQRSHYWLVKIKAAAKENGLTLQQFRNAFENYTGTNQIALTYKRMFDEFNKYNPRIKKLAAQAGGAPEAGAGDGKERKVALSEYYNFMGMKREQELAALQEHYRKIAEADNLSAEQKKAALEEYYRQREAIDNKYNVFYNQVMSKMGDAAKTALNSIDQASRQLVYNMMWGKGGWKEFQKSMGEIFKQLLADITYAIMRAAALQAILSATGLGIGGGGGLLSRAVGSLFEKGRTPPMYRSGRVPVLASGVPSDHFAAYIGTHEAVVNKQSTMANLSLLKWMNDNPGQSAAAAQAMNIAFTIPVTIDGREVGRATDTYRNEVARNSGSENYSRRRNYR